jgi:hypothetical protein
MPTTHDEQITELVSTVNENLADYAGVLAFDWQLDADHWATCNRRSGRGPIWRSLVRVVTNDEMARILSDARAA